MKHRSMLRLHFLLLLAAMAAWAADPLAQQVTIYRDNYGVPHIVGETEEATFFGYGYAQAEDHLERMMLQYRDAQGRRAEVEGFQALGDGYLHFIPYEYRWDGDYLQRLLRTKKCVVENKNKIDPNTYRILAAFARGVNEYIAGHRGDIPSWIDSVAAEDIEALERSHYMRFYSIHDALQKMTEKVYDFPDFGSNQWAIAPFRSANGHVMHVEHTHMPWANRFQNYEAHLITPGKLDAAGISWFGSPFFLDGLNDKITWSATWNEPNMADVYEEKINPENHLQYLYDRQWRDIRVDTETFRVKGPHGMESITLPVYYTHHGPVVHFDREKNRAYSVKLPNYDGVNYSTGMYGLMKAQNLAEFKAALGRQLMPRWNLLYSDSENIFWVHNGNVARRAEGYDWSKPVPGWTKETEWGPNFPFEQYPQLLNPASGFLQNCNNPPWVATKNSGLNPLAPAPYYLRTTPKPDAGEEALNTRGERLFEVLGQNKKFTLDDMKELAFDTKVMPADVIVPLLERAYAAKPSQDSQVTQAIELVRAWNRRSAEDSIAYTYIYYWGRSYQELFSEGKFARFVHYGRRKIDLDSAEEQDAGRRAFEAAVKRIQKQFGKSEVRWGDINVVSRGGKFPMDGTGLYDVLHPDEGVEQENGQMYCNDGWGDLLIVVEGNPKEIWSLLPYGESEHPSSPHFNDLAKLHSQRQAKRFWFTPEDIMAHTESVWGDRNRIQALVHTASEKKMKMRCILCLLALGPAVFCAELEVRITWGHESPVAAPYYVRLSAETSGVEIRDTAGYELESGEGLKDGAWQTTAGAGDIDGVTFKLVYPETAAARLQNLHIIWADLIAQSDADTARRLSHDPAFHPDTPKLTVLMNAEGTRGFTFGVNQLLEEKAMWVPSLHVFVAAGEHLVAFQDYQKELAAWKGKRILEQVKEEPEASYSQYTARWQDMGSPAYIHPNQPAPGHIVGLTWDSAIAKFGIDRGAGVWNDYGNPDHFRFWFDFGDLTKGILSTWKSQRLKDGLPVVTTVFERDEVRYEVEQFGYPLNGPPAERRGDIPMVLLQKVRATDLAGMARVIPVTMSHRRQFPAFVHTDVGLERHGNKQLLVESAFHKVLFAVEGLDQNVQWSGTHDYQREEKRVDATALLNLPANGSREFVVKLPSPMVNAADTTTLEAIDYAAARQATLDFWAGWVKRGAQFEVPEESVNDLFRATLWHALRLPRRHGGQQEGVQIDLPYSNFAYSQTGTPWPVNQAVYVDYMLFGLRGYHEVALEELLAQYRNNQEYNGHVNGYANWVSNTPGMLYAVAQDYLLYRDRVALQRLIPYSLKALDWCLQEVRDAEQRAGPGRGLVMGPLNDGTGEGFWAFNQAYMYAALERFGQILETIGHPRAGEALEAARKLRTATAEAFAGAAVRSTLVQLRDHTWIPYVPSEALTDHRILDQWYPTDVDTGAVHLLRLKAVPANGELADSLLNDHEDNLYLKGWGMANEPVYNQQGTAYLLRDEPKAAIRTFYSYMASAFSQSAFEPVEHRWTHGQYFGPPSTDGAWFELFRNMLVREVDDHTLLLAQATPRKWLGNGLKIEVQHAPTYFGPISFRIESHAEAGSILATVEFEKPSRPQSLLIRLRHPEGKPIRSVTLGGQNWKDFDSGKEWVRIENPSHDQYSVAAHY